MSRAAHVDRTHVEELAARLRAATCDAIAFHSALARSLDDSRGELERVLMLASVDAGEYRRVVVRAQLMLEAWQALYRGGEKRTSE